MSAGGISSLYTRVITALKHVMFVNVLRANISFHCHAGPSIVHNTFVTHCKICVKAWI